ncbi:Protein CBG24138 [Caenorhabditis briggsae]|uniref:Protein CBG24138 n=1 Tax=Caenorhabditis briggsae TaxID=6238 RepID=H8WGZ0_CAEBR|nr:Protein CBG24138 [Caenorhabditis briggsae]CCG58610.1 Protein CBG24138 [Caenorhabditis briggsae]
MSSDGQGMSTMDVTMTEETNKIGNMIKNNEMTDSDVPKVQPKVQNFEMPAFVAPDMVFYEPISSVRLVNF